MKTRPPKHRCCRPHSVSAFALINGFSARTAPIAVQIAFRTSAAALALFALSGLNLRSLAATDTWTGADSGPSTDWNTTDNWLYSSGSGPVASGDSLVFTSTNGSGSNILTDSLTNSSFIINGITFNAGAVAYTMTGNAFALGAGGITNNSANAEVINNAIVMAASTTVVVGSGDGTITLGGAVSGAGGVTLDSGAAGGTLSLSDATYTGATTVTQGVLNFTGGTFGSLTSAFTINGTSGTAQTATATISGGTVLAGTVNIGVSGSNNSALMTISGSANATFTTVNVGAGGVNTAQGLIIDTTGTVSLGTVLVPRDTNTATSGLTVQAGTVSALSVDVTIAGGSTTTDGNLNISGGSFTITDATGGLIIGDIDETNAAKAGHSAFLSMTGGTLTYLGSDGLIAANSPTAGNLSQTADVSITGGTANLTGISLNYTNSSTVTSTLLVNGGAYLYLGSVGLVANTPTGSVVSGTFGTATIGALAPWSSSLPITLTGTTTFQAANTTGTAENIVLNGALSGGGNVDITGPGTVTMTGTNSYTGNTAVAPGTTLAISGTGFLGSGAYAGNIADSGTFSYGSSATQTLSGAISGTGALIQNGPGTLTLSGANTYTGAITITTGTLAISGAGSLGSGAYGGSIADSGTFSYGSSAPQTISGAISGAGGVIQNGSGTLTLSGVSTYTGATTVAAGTLALTSAGSLGNTAITVSSGATFLGQPVSGNVQIGSTGATLNLTAGSSFSIGGGSIGTVTLNSTGGGAGTVLTLGGATLSFGIGTAGADELIVNDGIVTFSGGTDSIAITSAGGTPSSLTNLPLLSAPNGVLILGDFSLQNTSVNLGGTTVYNATLSLGGPGGDTELLVSLSPVGTANYYFTGKQSASWSTITNFATDHTGLTPQSPLLNSTSNVFLTADTVSSTPANYESEKLDGNYTINSLSFTGTDSAGSTPAATNAITLASGTGTALTIAAGGAFTDANGKNYAAGIGLVVQAGSAGHTISANIDLGASQTWEIDGSKPLTVSGTIADAAGTSLDILTKSGSGTLILTNTNTYDGGTIVARGTLMLGGGGALLAGSPLTVTGTGTFDLGSNSQTIGALSDGGVPTGTITASTGPATLTVINTAPSTFSGTITDNSANTGGAAVLALSLQGSSNVTLSGSNSFTGGTTLVSGNLTVASNYGLGSSTSGTGGLTVNNLAPVNIFFISANPQAAAINDNSTGTDNIILGNSAGGGSATTLYIGGNGGNSSINGVISDLSGSVPAAKGNLAVVGGGLLVLNGANTFTGTTMVSGSGPEGISTLELTNPLALQDSMLVYNDTDDTAPNVTFGSLDLTLAGLQGVGNLPYSSTITIGGTDSSLFLGNLSGSGSLAMNGTGTLQIGSGTAGGALYGGNTIVNEGTLILGGTTNLTGDVTLSGENGPCALVVQDNAVINSPTALVLETGNGNDFPAYNTVTVSGTATVDVAGLSFGNGANRVPVGAFLTVRGLGTVYDSGSTNLINTDGGTTTEAGVTLNLNGGTYATDNFILTNPGGNVLSTATINFNGGTLEALANDPTGSFFLPVIAQLTANILAGGAIINTNGFNDTIVQPLLSGTANDGGLTKTGAGILILAGSNTYLGPTNINGGELALANIGSIADTSRITFSGSNGGALQYSGSNTRDYSAKILNSTGPVAIDVNGQSIVFASPLAASNIGGLTVENADPGVGSLLLTASNVFSGPTTVSAGAALELGAGGSLPANSAVEVSGSLIAVTGNGGIGGSLTLGAGSVLSLVDQSTGMLTVGGGMTIGGTSAANLYFELDTDTSSNDSITVKGAALAFGAVGGVITLSNISGNNAPTLLQYTLLTDSAGLGTDQFSLSQSSLFIDGQSYLLSLSNSTSTSEIVSLSLASLNYYWTGAKNTGSWRLIGNFATDQTGATPWTSGSLSQTSNVFLTATNGKNLSQTLDGNYSINSLSFTGSGTSAGSASVTLATGTGTALTLDASAAFADASSNTYAVGTGLVVQPGAAADTISANINLGANQTWTINDSASNPLTVTGVIADGTGTSLDSLTKAGPGTLVLSAPETYDGGTTVSGGTLALGAAGSLLSTAALTVTGTGTFDLTGHNQTVAQLADGGASTGIITSSTGAATLTINNLTPASYGGAITDNNSLNGSSLALMLTGSSTVTLSGSSTYTGGTTLASGNLTVAGNYALGSPTSANANAGLMLNPITGNVNANFTSANPQIAALNNNPLATGSANVILGFVSGTNGSATTLNIGAGGGTSNFSGTISDQTATVAAAVGNLNVAGGSVNLNGTDTFTGTTSVSGGILTVGSPVALENSTLNYNNQGGTFNFGSQTAVTLGGLEGVENLALTNTNAAAVTLTIGNNNVTSTYNGSLNGPGAVIKVGTGTITFSNASYTGGTTINAGTLVFSGGSPGTATSMVTVGETGLGLNVTGGTLTSGTLDIALLGGQTGGSASITGSGSAIFGAVQIGSAADSAGSLTINTTGSVSLGTMLLFKLNSGAAANLGVGLTIEAGTVTALSVDGEGDGDKSTDVNISGGSLTVGNSSSDGAFQIGNAGDGGYLNMSGGSLTYSGTDGLLLATGAGSTGSATITSGTATLTGITLNYANSTTEISALTVGGTAAGAVPVLYLGNVGLVALQSGSTVTVSLGNAVVGATAAWSSQAPITLTGATTFQTANSNGNGNNITLAGVLSGTGGLTESGTGVLTLSGNDSYTGPTAVSGSGGRLVVSGSLTGTASISVASGAHLEVDGALINSGVASVSGFLNGTGSVDAVDINSGGTLGPGRSTIGALAAGVLTANGNVLFTGSASIFSIRLGVASPSDSDQLNIANGDSVTLDDATLKLTLGSAFEPQSAGFVYVLINGGAQLTGTMGTDQFSQGGQITDSNGDVYNIVYATNSTANGPGNDVDLVAAVPEPGTWAMLLGGIGLLGVWRRLRRN